MTPIVLRLYQARMSESFEAWYARVFGEDAEEEEAEEEEAEESEEEEAAEPEEEEGDEEPTVHEEIAKYLRRNGGGSPYGGKGSGSKGIGPYGGKGSGGKGKK